MRALLVFAALIPLSLLAASPASSQQNDTAAVKSAVEKSLPLLQKIGPPFAEHTGCVSCHHNTLPAMAVALARSRGLKVDDRVARENIEALRQKFTAAREKMMQGLGIPGDATTSAYVLLGFAADKQPPDKTTAAVIHYLIGKQAKDGRWQPVSYRPPMEYNDITVTAISLRALQLYGPQGRADEINRRIEWARTWLAGARAKTNEERAYKLLGLAWSGAGSPDIDKARKELMAEQRNDGGWSQLATLESDAYATGQALVALNQAGRLSADDPAYRRGREFLLKTQLKDGSWLIQSRSIPFQRYFESGFPHGKNQWISAAGSSWATMALILSLPASEPGDKTPVFR